MRILRRMLSLNMQTTGAAHHSLIGCEVRLNRGPQQAKLGMNGIELLKRHILFATGSLKKGLEKFKTSLLGLVAKCAMLRLI